MAYFSQQLINAITLGAIYGLIAIGYTMVYGIIGMINFAHGEVFMIGAFIFSHRLHDLRPARHRLRAGRDHSGAPDGDGLQCGLWLGDRTHGLPSLARFVGDLAPLISAIGVSIMLQNFVQLVQGARSKPGGQIVSGGYILFSADGFDVRVTWLQLIIVVVTVVLMAAFSWLIASTPLGRKQRACEQDMKMAALLGVDVDRTISLTFVMGAALAAVAGMLFLMYYGIIDFFIGFLAGIKAFTAAVLGGIGSMPGAMLGGLLIGLIEVFWAAYFSSEYKDVAVFGILVLVLIFRPSGLLGKPEIEKV